MANEAWTVRTPTEGPGKTPWIAGLAAVLLLAVAILFFSFVGKEETPPAPPQAVREAAQPTATVKADHPSDEPTLKKTSFAAHLVKTAIDPATEDAQAPEHWKKAVNLLALIQPGQDPIQGAWSAKDGAWASDGSPTARLGVPCKPPEEYDLKVTFTRTGGNEAVILVLGRPDRPDHQFAWILGGWNNTLHGFELIGGQRANENPTTSKREGALQNGKTYTAVIRVRRDRFQGYLDGTLVTEFATDYSNVSLPEYWRLTERHGFGLCSHESPTTFHSVELLDVTRPGTPTPTPTPTPAPDPNIEPKLEPGASEF